MISLETWSAKGRQFDYNGHPIFYVEEGAGDPLVCIHGFPTASWDWAWVWPELTKRFRVIAPDMIGFGFSAKPRASRREPPAEGGQYRRVETPAHKGRGDAILFPNRRRTSSLPRSTSPWRGDEAS